MAEEERTGPLISVAILCYNYGHLLQRALEACGRQTFSNFELIMINNGSSDDTEAVYQNFCIAHPEIPTTYVKIEENKGPSFGWREGLKYVAGTYVMFHDADDWMENHCLEELAKKALETNADRIIGGYQEVQADGTVSRMRKFPEHGAKMPSIMLQGVIFRYSLIIEHSLYFPEFSGYDLWLTVNFACYESACAVVGRVLYDYYINPSSGTSQFVETEKTNKKLEKLYRGHLETLSDAAKKISSLALKTEMEYLAVRNYYYSILEHYVRFPRGFAREHYEIMTADMKKYFPNYKKNRLIWPWGNGFEFDGSVGCAGIYILDRLHLIDCLSVFSKVMAGGKIFRK